MIIGILNEASSSDKNAAINLALQNRGHEIINIGMTGPEDKAVLNYLHTSFMAGLLLYTKTLDFVVSGCGTGQGFSIAANQYPGVSCGHIVDPLDAWLFRQINDGNAVSLMLNKGYGWAADVNLEFLFDALFAVPGGSGYPEHRKEVQKHAREGLMKVSITAHRPFDEIIKGLDVELLRQCAKNKVFLDLVTNAKSGEKAKEAFLKAIM